MLREDWQSGAEREAAHLKSSFIRLNVHRAVAVGAENPDRRIVEASHKLRIGVAVRFSSPADDGDLRMNGGEKGRENQ